MYAMITGASKGIGKEIAYNLAARHINVLLIARSENLLNQIAEDLRSKYGIDAKTLSANLAAQSSATIVFDWVKQQNVQINMLINNAGYGLSGDFEKYTAQQHADMMTLNMVTPVKLISLLLPMLKKQSQSYILNISSTAAYQAVPFLGPYSASKSFLLSFSRALRYELRKTNVSVTCVCPGATETDFGITAQIGKKGMEMGKKVNMRPQDVASISVNAMLNKRREVIVGFINKLGAFMVWLAPKKLSERVAAKFYQ